MCLLFVFASVPPSAFWPFCPTQSVSTPATWLPRHSFANFLRSAFCCTMMCSWSCSMKIWLFLPEAFSTTKSWFLMTSDAFQPVASLTLGFPWLPYRFVKPVLFWLLIFHSLPAWCLAWRDICPIYDVLHGDGGFFEPFLLYLSFCWSWLSLFDFFPFLPFSLTDLLHLVLSNLFISLCRSDLTSSICFDFFFTSLSSSLGFTITLPGLVLSLH